MRIIITHSLSIIMAAEDRTVVMRKNIWSDIEEVSHPVMVGSKEMQERAPGDLITSMKVVVCTLTTR